MIQMLEVSLVQKQRLSLGLFVVGMPGYKDPLSSLTTINTECPYVHGGWRSHCQYAVTRLGKRFKRSRPARLRKKELRPSRRETAFLVVEELQHSRPL